MVTAVLALFAVLLLGPVPAALARAGWPVRDPWSGLATWLAVVVGAALTCDAVLVRAGAAADGGGRVLLLTAAAALTCGQVAALGYVGVHGWARRRRHRALLDLVGDWDPATESLVIDHEVPLAYSVPGRQGVIVLSRACRTAMPDLNVRAMIAHERAHLNGHHGLILRPFVAWRLCLPMLPAATMAMEHAGLLLEMIADAAAARATTPQAALGAMHRIATGPGRLGQARTGGFHADDDGWVPSRAALARARRLLRSPRPLSRTAVATTWTLSAATVLFPIIATATAVATR